MLHAWVQSPVSTTNLQLGPVVTGLKVGRPEASDIPEPKAASQIVLASPPAGYGPRLSAPRRALTLPKGCRRSATCSAPQLQPPGSGQQDSSRIFTASSKA